MARPSAAPLSPRKRPKLPPAKDRAQRAFAEVAVRKNEAPSPEILTKAHQEKVPAGARLWGFVRHFDFGEALKGEDTKSVELAEQDASLWWDGERQRFLIVSENRIIDDLAPLQFIQFVRELRDVTSRILFKFERKQDGSAGRAQRVWA
jgi:hypothetical protein